MSPSSAPNLSKEEARIFRTAGGRDINLFLTSPPGSADNVPGAAQSPELLRVGCSGLGRSGEKFGSRKFLDSYIMPSRYHQSRTAEPAPNPHSGSDLEDGGGGGGGLRGESLDMTSGSHSHRAPITKVWAIPHSIQRAISVSVVSLC